MVCRSTDGKELGFDNLSSFTTDDEEAAACAAGHLIAKGHRRIGIIGGIPGTAGAQPGYGFSTKRITGVVKELKKNGIEFDYSGDHEPSAYFAESGYKAAVRLLKKTPGLTGLICLNDEIALGAMRAIRDMGLRVPDDISLIGFNGNDYTRYSIPRLATIRQDVVMLARKSVDDLLLRISYGSPAVHETIPYEYVDGESVAPPHK